MKPIDYRNETFWDVLDRITGQRDRTLAAWQSHGPCTTEQLAERSGLSILTLRPRTTDLYQIGAVVLVGREGTSGVYRAATTAEMLDHFSRAKREACEPQMEMKL